MSRRTSFAAVDLGASSGRIVLGEWDGSRFSIEPLHRFPNAPVAAGGNLYWNALGIWSQILEGLRQISARGEGRLDGIGVDTWGVDFALLDRRGRLIGNPVSYRDPRTNGMPEEVFSLIDEASVFTQTGVATMSINTLFQLYSMVRAQDPQLGIAQTLLMIPDLFLYFLCGARNIEHSEATTTQMYSPAHRTWAEKLIGKLGIPTGIFPPVVMPGTVVGELLPEIVQSAGFLAPVPVIAVASHDTASAVAAIPYLDPQSAFLSSGTWSLMGVETDGPVTSEAAQHLHLTNEGGPAGSNLLLRNLTGLWIVQECQKQWEREGLRLDWSEIVEAAKSAGPSSAWIDPNAAVFQSPADMPEAIGFYCRSTGQMAPETPGALARCAFESLALSYRSVLESLEAATGRHLETIRVVGGGSRNRFLCQMIADACAREVVAGPAEASALGNIMLQAIATGWLPNLEAARQALAESVDCARFGPQPGISPAMDRTYVRFQDLLEPDSKARVD